MKKINENGFNLVELLIIMAVIAVMVGISGPMLVQQIPKWHMNGTARDVASKLMMARMRAIQDNIDYGVVFTFGAIDTFRIVKWNVDTNNWDLVGVQGLGSDDIDLDLEGCVANNRVEFFPNGRGIDDSGVTSCPAGTDGVPEVLVMTITTLAGTPLVATIDINPITGHIQVN